MGAKIAGVRVEVCPDASPTMRFDVPRRQSSHSAACLINHLAIFVAECVNWVERCRKSPCHQANTGSKAPAIRVISVKMGEFDRARRYFDIAIRSGDQLASRTRVPLIPCLARECKINIEDFTPPPKTGGHNNAMDGG